MKLNIFTSTIKDGIMSNNKKYFPNLSKEEVKIIYNLNVKRFLEKYNLRIEDMIKLNDKGNKVTSRVVTDNNKIYKDKILLLKENTTNIPIIVETDDDPVIVATAKNEKNETIAAISKASIENLSNNLIHEMTEILMKETDAATFEMTFYIGPCPSKENYLIQDKSKVNTKFFEKALEEKNKKLYLDLRYAIFNELYLEIVDPNNIYFDSTNTVSSSKYFSEIGNKPGKHLTCIVFKEEN